ncbi:MAG: hypothetical protein IJL85_00990 [Erysipelotrichaceae bacterium]|nr:hypothetical protein [Erysipelotrichaceae bacterium]
MLILFIILIISYLLGNIKIKGVSFGPSMIMLVSLIFGHFGYRISDQIKSLGLLLFVCPLGITAGPAFLHNFKRNARIYIINGFVIVFSAALLTLLLIKKTGLDPALALGLFTGSLTSTPGLAAASEVSQSPLTVAGYGISYPFGVIGVTLFCQLFARKDRSVSEIRKTENAKNDQKYYLIDRSGILNFSITIVFGILIGMIRIPLPHGLSFSFGNAGGTLIAGLIMGSVRHIGGLSLAIDDHVLGVIKDLGLSFFLLGSGLEAGSEIVSILQQHGIILLFYGALITLLPMLVSYFITMKLSRLGLLEALGSISGGMTSTPALAALSQHDSGNRAVSAYIATYPIALISVVILTQIIYLLSI